MKLYTILFFILLNFFHSCKGQNPNLSNSTEPSAQISIGHPVFNLGKNIGCIYQDKNKNYWFASNGEGVFRYDGKVMTQMTIQDGLVSNFVLKIEEDINGQLWFSTRDGVCSFDGLRFKNYTDSMNEKPYGKLQYKQGGLFFSLLNGLCFYDGKSFTNFAIHPETYNPEPYQINRPYSVYSTLVDKQGKAWFGTQERGVCRYDGDSFIYFTEHGLDKAAVRTLFQDKAGTIWAGNNGAGLFRFNGKEFANFTDEKGIANPEFLKKLKGKDGTLARPWTINEDEFGNLFIGTIDAGVWKYNGKQLINYTTKDGLSGNSIWNIYKDNKGELWFVSNGESIYKFDGNEFVKINFH